MNTNNDQAPQLPQNAVISRFVSVKLSREIVEGMISTYEFLEWQTKALMMQRNVKNTKRT
jgi:hypothetical protein